MRRSSCFFGALVLTLTLCLSACDGAPAPSSPSPDPMSTPTASQTPAATPTPTPPAEAENEPPVWGDQVFARQYTAGDGATVMTVKYTLPMVQNTDTCPAGLAINQWYKDEGQSRMSSAEENYEMVVADYDVSAAAGLTFTPTTEEMSYTVTRQDESVISVCREWYVNGGGAYPSVFRLSEQFDAVTGAQLNFAHFCSDADAVLEQVTDAFLAQPDLSQAVAEGALTREEIAAAVQPEDFYLTDSGYVFWIQGNTLPAVHSPVEVTLSYDALGG